MSTLAKALKEKNKLKLEIAQLQKRFNTYNSVIKGNQRPFDLKITEKELTEKIFQLIQLKSVITKSNQAVQDKIYRLAEIKGLIKFYKDVPIKQGKSAERYSSEATEYEALFNESEIYIRIENLQKEADEIQDILETFNHKTEL